jgi:AbrB family looped-hinge helix DNA binding protein
MEPIVKLSGKHQIVIPRAVRQRFGLRAGDKFLVEVQGNTIVLFPLPRNFTKYMLGLHKHIWQDVDVAKYLREERKGWR